MSAASLEKSVAKIVQIFKSANVLIYFKEILKFGLILFKKEMTMTYFVYIIQSEKSKILYKGITTDPEKRLFEHNNNFSRYTSGKGPWKLVFLAPFENKRSALIRERQLKRANKEYLKWLIKNYLNENT